MGAKDVIKSSVYEALGGGTGLTTGSIILTIIIACLIGMYIFMVYKCSAKSAFYSKDLNMTIAGMPIVVAAIMIAMQSNLLVSFGMVGALSIVRFRNAIKNPLDLLYLFWSISGGIIVGVGLYVLAVVFSIIMTLMLIILNRIPNAKGADLAVIRLTGQEGGCEEILKVFKDKSKYFKEKSRSIKSGETELIVEFNSSKREELIADISKCANVRLVNYLSHDGEVRV